MMETMAPLGDPPGGASSWTWSALVGRLVACQWCSGCPVAEDLAPDLPEFASLDLQVSQVERRLPTLEEFPHEVTLAGHEGRCELVGERDVAGVIRGEKCPHSPHRR